MITYIFLASFLDTREILCRNQNHNNKIYPDHYFPDENFIDNYLNYRIVNDPAKNMLYSAFGKNWTDYVLRNIIFPK